MLGSTRRRISQWLESACLTRNPIRATAARWRKGAFRTEPLEVRQLLTGDFEWVQTLSGTGDSWAQDVVSDAAGNLYTVGNFGGTVDMDPGPGTTNFTSIGNAGGSNDLFLTRSDSAGNLTWARAIRGASVSVSAGGITLDSLGNILVVGSFTGSVDFDPGSGTAVRSSSGAWDIFVVKLSGSGEFQWVRTFGGTSSDLGESVVTDSSNAVYIGGYFSGSVDFDPAPGFSEDGGGGFVVKLNSSGSFQWVETGGLARIGDLKVSGQRVYALGKTQSMGGAESIDVLALSRQSGGRIFTRTFIATVSLQTGGLIAYPDGSTVFVGNLYPYNDDPASITFDQHVVSNPSPSKMSTAFLVRLDASGTTEWAKSMPAANTSITKVAMNPDGDIYIGGRVAGSIDVDPGPGVMSLGAGSADVFVAAYSSSGELRWARSTSSDNDPQASVFIKGLTFLPNGSVVSVGRFSGTTNFDPAGFVQRTTSGTGQAFLWALSPDLRFTFSGITTGDVLLKRNGQMLELWFKGTFTFGQYVLQDAAPVKGIRSIRITDNENANSLTVDYQSGGGFGISEGIHFGSVSGNDVISVIGNGNEGVTFAPRATAAMTGKLQAYGGEISFAPIPALSVTNFQHLSVETQGSADVVSISAVSGQTKSLIAGTTGGIAISPLTFDRVRDLTINTGLNDGLLAQSNDSVTFNVDSYEAQGLKNVFVRTGKGNDVLTVNGPSVALPVDEGTFWFLGGTGADRITAIGDTNWDLNDVRLASGSGGRVQLYDVELASLTGGAGKNHLNASQFSGDVTLDGGANNDLLRGGSGHDVIFGGTGSDRIFGGAGDDVIHGQDNNDQIWGEAGDDTIWGSGGNDQIWGGDGNDWISGDAGDDVVYGGEGDDVVRGGTNNDRLFGDAGNDSYFGDGGVDLYDLQGTNNAEELQLVRLSATSAQFRRKPRGLTSILEQDTITMDGTDEFLVSALDGDDQITIDNLFTQLGSVDGGLGTDTCTGPAAWPKISC